MKVQYSMMEAGLTWLNPSISRHFLRLEPDMHCARRKLPEESLDGQYWVLVQAFCLACNMNRRDGECARRMLQSLSRSELADRFPAIVRALSRWCQRDLAGSRRQFRSHLREYPTDVVAVFMLHMFDFLHGNRDLYPDYLLADERCEDPDFGHFYSGILAFSLCEQGDAELARAALPIARKACERGEPGIYSVHALVHCWHGAGEHGSIVDFLTGCIGMWRDNPGMNMHVGWHLAVSLLAMGRMDEAIRAYRDCRALMAGDDAEQDLDAVNFCVRLFLDHGLTAELTAHCRELARNWAPSIYNSWSGFNDIHAAFAFLMAGEESLLRKLLHRYRSLPGDVPHSHVSQLVIQAIADFMREDHASCLDRLETARPEWFRIGGSVAQREILPLLARAAAERLDAPARRERRDAIAT